MAILQASSLEASLSIRWRFRFPSHDVAVNNPTRWPGNDLILSLITG